MRLVRSLQPWGSGTGIRLQVTDCVPAPRPSRQWAAPCPWAALVRAIAPSFQTRFPTTSPRGRRPVPLRVCLALELLQHAFGASDEARCHRLRTDFAVLYACGFRAYQVNPAPAPFVPPAPLGAFRSRIDAARMEEWIASHAAAAMAAGLLSPAPLVIDTFPSAQGLPPGFAVPPASPRAIRGLPALCCPGSPRSQRPAGVSREGQSARDMRAQGSAASMRLSCVRLCMPAVF